MRQPTARVKVAGRMDETQSHIFYLEIVENRYNELRQHIAKHYCDTFGLAWLNVPIDTAIELLAKYAKPTWELEESQLMQRKQAARGDEVASE